jgi:pilus assembly protein CpaB
MLKNRKTQNIVITLLAVTLGLSTYLFLLTLNGNATATKSDVLAYVATTEIPAGTTFQLMLQNSWITQKSIPASIATTQAITPSSNFTEEKISTSLINSGQLILQSMFAPAKNYASGLNIPKGLLAISISLDDVSRVANFVVPGSRVVIFTTGANSKKSDAVTRVLISNALVLAIGPVVQTPQNGAQVTSSPLVTLAVNPYEAEKIIHANQNSKLNLALAYSNNPNNIDLPQAGLSSASLFGQS